MENKAKMWIITTIIVGVILAIFLGIYTYRLGGISETNIINVQKLADEGNDVYDSPNSVFNEAVVTSSVEEKVSPNAIITMKRYYKGCDHIIREVVDVPKEIINLTKESVQNYYAGWKIDNYSPTDITIYQEFPGICNEHYVIKEHDGILGIYIENEEGILEWQEDTEIEVQYLPEEDIEEFKVGVKVVGKENLYMFIEDYE